MTIQTPGRVYNLDNEFVCDSAGLLQEIVDELPETGGKINISEGTLLVDGPVQIDKSDVVIAGSGTSTIIDFINQEGDNFVVGDNQDTISNIKFQDFQLTSSCNKLSGSGIRVNKGFKVWVQDVFIQNQYRSIYLLNTTQVWLFNLPIRNSKENGVTIEANTGCGFDYYLTNLVMDNPDISNNGIGIAWFGGENVQIYGGDIIHFVTGLDINPGVDQESRWGVIHGTQFDTCGNNGVHIGNTDSGNVAGITFTNTWTGSNENYGVLVDKPGSGYLQGVRFLGHKSMNNGLAGFRLAGGIDTHISSSDIISNSSAVSGTRHGIEIASGVSDWSINNCRIGNGYGHGNSQQNGINIDTGITNHYRIIGNDLRGNSGDAVSNGATGENYIIEDNLV